ncbi:hypothetical protein Y025_6261 [Burkholderia pseudomallei TSV32]|nr:hypothetical protein Y025_6261 [Burkholderia pseudomallei TSV32]VBH33438.1 Uncharacterised protein [Burkholderia pseudomallei]
MFSTFNAVALAMTGSIVVTPPCTADAPDFVPLALPLSPPIVRPGTACPGSKPSDGIDALPAVLLMLTPVPEIVPFEPKVES